MSDVEFSAWPTPFQDKDVFVLEVRCGSGGVRIDNFAAGSSIEVPEVHPGEEYLLVRLVDTNDGTIYRVASDDARAFRVLDEDGLTQLWDERAKQNVKVSGASFRVRNHDWAKESPLPFLHWTEEGWSYVIASGDDCVEILCEKSPKVSIEGRVMPQAINKRS